MALQMRTIEQDTAMRQARARQWCVLALVGSLLLVGYIAALSWATREVEAGVDRSLQSLPVVMRDSADQS